MTLCPSSRDCAEAPARNGKKRLRTCRDHVPLPAAAQAPAAAASASGAAAAPAAEAVASPAGELETVDEEAAADVDDVSAPPPPLPARL